MKYSESELSLKHDNKFDVIKLNQDICNSISRIRWWNL